MSLDRFSRRNYIYNGLITSHYPNHAIYNLDSVLSLPRLLVEMIAFSQPGRLELMPACPSDLPAGTLTGIRIHGGHKLDVTWQDGKLETATLRVGKDERLTVICGGVKQTLNLIAGETMHLDSTVRRRHLTTA